MLSFKRVEFEGTSFNHVRTFFPNLLLCCLEIFRSLPTDFSLKTSGSIAYDEAVYCIQDQFWLPLITSQISVSVGHLEAIENIKTYSG